MSELIPYPIVDEVYSANLDVESGELFKIYELSTVKDNTKSEDLDYFVQIKEKEDDLQWILLTSDKSKQAGSPFETYYKGVCEMDIYGFICTESDLRGVINLVVNYYEREHDINIDKNELNTELGSNII